MKVFVLIVTYNGMQWIEKCIESVINSTVACDIIVVDNNSKDGTMAFIKKKYPKIILLEQNENLGFGAANNIGMTYALKHDADFVFLLNQDAYLQPETVKKVMEVYKSNPEYGIISPIHLNGEANNLDKNFFTYVKKNEELLQDAIKGDFSKSIYSVPFVNAAAWFLPKKILENIGGFDPIFHHYTEDNNYCQRTLYHGLKIGVVPNCFVLHDREFRQEEPNSNEYNITKKERYLKYMWGNINDKKVPEAINRHKKYLKILVLKLFFKFQYKKMRYYSKELALTNRITPEIFKSRQINSKTGSHYLY